MSKREEIRVWAANYEDTLLLAPVDGVPHPANAATELVVCRDEGELAITLDLAGVRRLRLALQQIERKAKEGTL